MSSPGARITSCRPMSGGRPPVPAGRSTTAVGACPWNGSLPGSSPMATAAYPATTPSLDRVLRGEADESLVAAQGAGKSEKGQVVSGAAFVAGAESAVAREPRQVRSMTHRRRPNRSLDSMPLRAMRTPIRFQRSHLRRSARS
ncbi:hypothetical protein ADK64_38515 [Streptomyces sp. MMG1121]|nr:hypothetical protein ADK64_38515 [Streptomyces sp. MMG1121]